MSEHYGVSLPERCLREISKTNVDVGDLPDRAQIERDEHIGSSVARLDDRGSEVDIDAGMLVVETITRNVFFRKADADATACPFFSDPDRAAHSNGIFEQIAHSGQMVCTERYIERHGNPPGLKRP